jgi:large subunit ribosomal protein L24
MCALVMKRQKMKIKKGDKVIVLTGKDRGKRGEVVKVIPSERKLVVSGINIAKKHVKPSHTYPNGGIISLEMPIHSSNVALLDPKVDIATKVGYKTLADGKKVRFAKKSNEVIDNV